MSPLPACIRSMADWSEYLVENSGGPPITSAR